MSGETLTTRSVGPHRLALVDSAGAALSSEADALDLIGATYGLDAEWLVIPVQRLAPDFLELSNRKAGLFLQKLVNYRWKVAIIGDIASAQQGSAAVRDFVRESNRGSQIRFADSMDHLIDALRESRSASSTS